MVGRRFGRRRRGRIFLIPPPPLYPAPLTFSRASKISKKIGKMESVIKAHKALLKKILKGKRVFDNSMIPQIEVCAKAWGLLRLIEDSNLNAPTIEQQSREGLNRTKANPAIKLYLETLDRYQRGIKALGLNHDSKAPVIAVERDSLADFLNEVNQD